MDVHLRDALCNLLLSDTDTDTDTIHDFRTKT